MQEPTRAELAAQGEIPTFVVISRKKGGKSSFARAYVRSFVRSSDFLIVDPQSMHWPSMYHGRASIVKSVAAFKSLKRPEPGWAYIFRGVPGEDVARLALDMGDCTYIDDESDQNIGKDVKVDRNSARYQMGNMNTQQFVAAMFLFRRPADVWLTMMSNATHAVIGVVGESELERIEKDFGATAAQEVAALPDPRSNPSGVYMVLVELTGKGSVRRIFVPHTGPAPEVKDAAQEG